MNKKIKHGVGIFIGLILILILVSIILSFVFKPKPQPGIYYSDEPTDWIEENPYSDEEIIISVKKATKEQGIFDIRQQSLIYNGDTIPFFYHGSYKGNLFDVAYLSQDFYSELEKEGADELELAKKYSLFRIGPRFVPGDGIIEGFIMAKIEDDFPVFYIFIDEDFKEKLEYVNIVWGDDLSDPENVNIKEFQFTEYEKGVYLEKIETDTDWISDSPKKGGVIVGEANLSTLTVQSMFVLNQTFMYIR